MAKSGVLIVKDRLKQVLKAISSLPQQDVLVGVPEDKTQRNKSGPTNAFLSYVHEFGAPEANIPARPFLIPGIRDARDKLAGYFRQAAEGAFAGDKGRMDRALHTAGLTGQSAVRRKINTGPFLPLAPSTLAARRRRGHSGTRPLVETGQLRNALTYVIRKNDKPTVIR